MLLMLQLLLPWQFFKTSGGPHLMLGMSCCGGSCHALVLHHMGATVGSVWGLYEPLHADSSGVGECSSSYGRRRVQNTNSHVTQFTLAYVQIVIQGSWRVINARTHQSGHASMQLVASLLSRCADCTSVDFRLSLMPVVMTQQYCVHHLDASAESFMWCSMHIDTTQLLLEHLIDASCSHASC